MLYSRSAANGISVDELEQLKVKWRSIITRRSKAAARIHAEVRSDAFAGVLHAFDNEPQLVNTILDGFLAVTREEIQAARRNICETKSAPSFSARP